MGMRRMREENEGWAVVRINEGRMEEEEAEGGERREKGGGEGRSE
jgi:hypothetical protein